MMIPTMYSTVKTRSPSARPQRFRIFAIGSFMTPPTTLDRICAVLT